MGGPFVTFVFPVLGDIAGGGMEDTEAGSSGDGHILQQPKLVGVGGGDVIIAQRFPLVTPNQRCVRREQLGAVILVGIADTAPGAADIDGFRCVAQDTVQPLIIQAAYQSFNLAGCVTELIPELLDMVDNGQIKFNPAVELSYLAREEQQDFLSAMDFAQAAPSLSQAQRIKKLAQEGECTLDAMCEIMNEVKKGELDRVTFKTDSLRKYFPKSYTSKQMEDKIIQLLEQWQKKREKSMER